ncbi:kp4 domain-containing protein [Purpureocillium lavendulum]|uniref:Kp4 domain-containing protein n=1 Tax=Purpureocillium lavendulum TaxID=1247861 RepID=A0AB34G1M8_9HYPO|nr:kp4 domain-containing protein [Purpureocillium lavendulum]
MAPWQMRLSAVLAIVLAALLAAAAKAKGSCDGSSICDHSLDLGDGSVMDRILSHTVVMPLDHVFKNGEHIICEYWDWGPTGFCAFVEGSKSGVKGKEVIRLLKEIKKRGCTKCGSYPVNGEKGAKDWDGRLKIDYVHNTHCSKLCLSSH